MAVWHKDELAAIADADDLHISPFREDCCDLWHANLDLVGCG